MFDSLDACYRLVSFDDRQFRCQKDVNNNIYKNKCSCKMWLRFKRFNYEIDKEEYDEDKDKY